MRDPRLAQIAVLLSLCAWAGFGLDLEIDGAVALCGVAAALATELLGRRLRGEPLRPEGTSICAAR